jgi:hypothetical protein
MSNVSKSAQLQGHKTIPILVFVFSFKGLDNRDEDPPLLAIEDET